MHPQCHVSIELFVWEIDSGEAVEESSMHVPIADCLKDMTPSISQSQTAFDPLEINMPPNSEAVVLNLEENVLRVALKRQQELARWK